MSFDRGAKTQFFEAWQELIPQEMLKRDFVTKKLEFYLRIYFVVYIYHPYNNQNYRQQSQSELNIEQADFKDFLDSRGSELSKTSEFLAYYALPYIANPMEHPSFQALFSMEWVNQLKTKLKSFIHERAFELGLPHLSQQRSLLLDIFETKNSNSSENVNSSSTDKNNQSMAQTQQQQINQQQAGEEMNNRLAQMQRTLVQF